MIKGLAGLSGHRCPTVLQIEAAECGAAALAMILEYHGRKVSLEILREQCGVSRDGVNAGDIVEAALAHGLEAHGYRLEPEDLVDYALPMILHWNFNHFVVLEGASFGKILINDPAVGRRRIDFEEFHTSFTGIALVFKPGEHFERGGNARSVWRAFTRRIQNPSGILYLLAVGLLMLVPGLATAAFAKVFIDDILIGQNYSWFAPLVWAMVIAMICRGVLFWLRQTSLIKFRLSLVYQQTGQFFQHMLNLPIPFFSQRLTGELIRRIRNNERVADLLTGDLANALLSAIAATAYGALLFWVHPGLAMIPLLVALAHVALLKWSDRYRQEESLHNSIEYGRLQGIGAGGLFQIESLKAAGGEAGFFGRWLGVHARAVNSQQKLGRFDAWVGSASPLLNDANNLAILTLGAFFVIQGQLTVGTLVAFRSLAGSFINPFCSLVGLTQQFQEARGMMEQLDDTLLYPEQAEPKSTADLPPLQGSVTVRNLSFGYNHLGEPVVSQINLTLEAGSRVALVGASGCGKSTIAKLVAGLYEPWQGQVLFDGRDLSTIPRKERAAAIAMVDQHISLFRGSIRDNITLWDQTIPEKDIEEAAMAAGIHDVILGRSGGYDEMLGEDGGGLSMGQRQRLEIARALVRKPKVLILDEATSALDTLVELDILRNIRRMGCTCLIAAHRLSTIRDCDEIVVLHAGQIVERGTHDSLQKMRGAYADLINMYLEEVGF